MISEHLDYYSLTLDYTKLKLHLKTIFFSCLVRIVHVLQALRREGERGTMNDRMGCSTEANVKFKRNHQLVGVQGLLNIFISTIQLIFRSKFDLYN